MVHAEQNCSEWGSVFAPVMRNQSIGAATTQHADVFARQQRQAAAVSFPAPKSFVLLQIGNQCVKLTYSELGAGLPAWVPPVLQSLSERWGLEQGWDSYDAKPTELQHAVQLLNYLSAFLMEGSALPVITPLSDGGLQAEWHRNNQDFEIMVPADEPASYYYYDAATQSGEEEELNAENFARVRTIIEKIQE